MADRQTAGREFLAGIVTHLPDDVRAGFETFLASGDPKAQQVIAAVGDGALRQTDYSRQLNELGTVKSQLETWKQQLATWHAENPGSPGADGQPAAGGDRPTMPTSAAPTVTSGLTKDEMVAEINRREIYVAGYVADVAALTMQHFQNFGETLDTTTLLQHPKLGELGIRGAYADVHKAKIEAKAAADAAKARETLKADLRRELEAEAAARGGAPPYPVGDGGGSPLDHLGGKADDYSLESAVALYRSLPSQQAGTR